MRTRTVQSYFREDVVDGSLEWEQSLRRLRDDAIKLHLYFERQDSTQEFRDFVPRKLDPFLSSLTKKKLSTVVRHSRVREPIMSWSVEQLVVIEQLGDLGRFPNFPKRALGLLTGKHLKGISIAAAGVVLASAIGYAVVKWPAFGAVVFAVGASSRRSFEAGPLAEIWKASTGWLLTPTTEKIHVMNARYMGGLEQAVNRFYDRTDAWFANKKWRRWVGLKTPTKEQATAAAAERNESPKTATLAEDKTSLAGMTADQQEQNWVKCLRVWVAIQKRFMQLIRNTQHVGRVLMLISAHDEQGASVEAETIDTKLLVLQTQADSILDIYRNRILQDRDLSTVEKDRRNQMLESVFDGFEIAAARPWLEPWSTEAEINTMKTEAAKRLAELRVLGLSKRDETRLIKIQEDRGRGITALSTALALNVARTFMTAEANRNLEEEAREFARAVREGFGLEALDQRYLYLVQYRVRKMGFQIGDAHPADRNRLLDSSPSRACRALFAPSGT